MPEGASATFTVSLSAAQTTASTVAYTLAGTGGATLGTDTTAQPTTGTLTFAAGEVTKTIVVPFTADTISPETGEGVSVTLSTPSTGTLLSTTAAAVTVAITDVPVTYTLTSNATSVFEGAPITYTLTASIASTTATTINFSVVPGDAAAPNQGTSNTNLNDFAAGAFNPAAVVLAAGATTATYVVTSATDTLTELPENYSVRAVIGTTTVATVTTSLLDGTGTPVVSSFTLTTGVDSLVGTTGDDIFNAILGTGATLNSFDNLNAGAGIDTLNIADNSAAAFAMPASTTLSGFENVILSRSGTGAADVTVTNSTFGSGIQTFSVVNAGANTAGAVSVTLASTNNVSAVATGTAFTTLTVVDTDATSTTTQGNTLATVTATKATGAVQINGNGVTTVNLNTIGTLTTITSAAGIRALTVNATGTGAIAGLTDAQATTATLNQAGNQAFGALTVAKATTINVNATATASTDATTATIAGAVATALNIGGTHAQTLTITNAANPLLATITVTGSGGVALGDLSLLGALTSINTAAATNVASASSAANATVANSVILGVNTAFTGGAGADTVTVGATTKAVNLGAGTNTANITVTALSTGGTVTGAGTDTLGLSDANAQTLSTVNVAQTAFKTNVTGFSKLALGTQTANTTIVQGGFAVFDTVSFTELANASVTTLTNLTTGSRVNITNAGVTSTGGLTTAGSLGSNATDALTVGFTSTAPTQTSTYGTITTPNLVNLNLISSGSTTANIGGVNTVVISDAALKVLTVSGTNGFALGTLTGATGFTTLNASGLTGAAGISVTLDANQFSTTITGSSGTAADTINANAVLNTVTITSTSTGLATLTGASGAFVVSSW